MAAITRFDFDVSEMTRKCGCCTTFVVPNEIQIHQQKEGLPLYAMIAMQNKSNPFRCYPVVLDTRKLATCSFSHLFHFLFDILKNGNRHCFESISIHNDVMEEYTDIMT